MKKTIIVLLIIAMSFIMTANAVMAAAAAPKGSLERSRVVEKPIIYEPPKVYKDYVASTPAPVSGEVTQNTNSGSNSAITPGAPDAPASAGNTAAAPEASVDPAKAKSNSLMFLVIFLLLAILVVGGGLGYVALNKHKEIKERDF
jgi:flagellar basal body-associated protein FliL